jgi:photosystem II stability/assembly factor-like uncharacterized protein
MTALLTLLSVICLQHAGVSGDTCENAIEIFDGSTTFNTSKHSDSGYSVESNCDLMGILYKDIWFSYHAKYDGVITLSTCDMNSFDTSIIVYEINEDCGSLVYRTCSGDVFNDPSCQPYHSALDFIASMDADYIIRVGGWDENSYGSGTLELTNEKQDDPSNCPSDINNDQVTNVSDVLEVINQWGPCPACSADLDGNNVVNVSDLLVVIGAWGPCPIVGTWQVLLNSPVAPYYHHDDMVVIGDTMWVCNISGEIWKSTDAGDSWTRVLYQSGSSFRSLTFVDEMNGWVGNLGPGSWVGSTTDLNPLYSTTDGGLTWTPILSTAIQGPIPDGICGLQAIGPNTIHGAGRYAGDAYFISSTDGGQTWISQDLSADYNMFVDVLFLTPEEGYITGNSPPGVATLLYTDDGGETWTTKITNNASHYWKMGFASESFGYAVCSLGWEEEMWVQTYDGGKSWTDRFYMDGFEANGIGFMNEQLGWIGGHENYTLETTDGGDSWQSFQIDRVYGDSINKFLKVSDDVMYAVGNRIYKYSSGTRSSHEDPEGEPFDNSLCTITATTSGDRTAISYTVPEDDNVQITVYISGGLIYDRPLEKYQTAGNYTIDLKTPDDAPQLYVAIVTGQYRQRTKFVDLP